MKCTYCKHNYVKPCNGKDKTCANKKWIDQQKKKK